MKNILNLPVLGLNANWQASDVYTVEKALGMMFSGAAVGVDISEGGMTPVKWKDWVSLPVLDEDDKIGTVGNPVRVPRIVIAVNYREFKMRKISLNGDNLAKVFGYRCGYTNEFVPKEEGSMDHVVPKDRGGKYEWKNAIYTSKRLNNKKSNKTPEEAGLRVLIPPKVSPEITPAKKIVLDHGVRFPEWKAFLKDAIN